MQYSQYRFKFYFNASHAIYLSGELGQSHPHTWEVVLNVMRVADSFVLFNEVEKICEGFLAQYQDIYINSVPPFTTINPTIENICAHFKTQIQDMLHEKGWILLSIELSETPSRSYLISVADELDAGKPRNDKQTEQSLQDLVERLTTKKIQELSGDDVPEEQKESIPQLNQIGRRARKNKKEKGR